MKKLMIKMILFIILIYFVCGISFKIYHFVIISKVYKKLENFIHEKDRFYSIIEISEKQDRKFISSKQIFKKDNGVKYFRTDVNENNIFFEIKNFETGEIHIWKNGKGLDESETCIGSNECITDISTLFYTNEKLEMKKLLRIYAIKSIKYNDEDCYEIITESEVIVVSKDTYLPIYMCKNMNGLMSGETVKVEYFYCFEVGTVSDEKMKMP